MGSKIYIYRPKRRWKRHIRRGDIINIPKKQLREINEYGCFYDSETCACYISRKYSGETFCTDWIPIEQTSFYYFLNNKTGE